MMYAMRLWLRGLWMAMGKRYSPYCRFFFPALISLSSRSVMPRFWEKAEPIMRKTTFKCSHAAALEAKIKSLPQSFTCAECARKTLKIVNKGTRRSILEKLLSLVSLPPNETMKMVLSRLQRSQKRNAKPHERWLGFDLSTFGGFSSAHRTAG